MSFKDTLNKVFIVATTATLITNLTLLVRSLLQVLLYHTLNGCSSGYPSSLFKDFKGL